MIISNKGINQNKMIPGLRFFFLLQIVNQAMSVYTPLVDYFGKEIPLSLSTGELVIFSTSGKIAKINTKAEIVKEVKFPYPLSPMSQAVQMEDKILLFSFESYTIVYMFDLDLNGEIVGIVLDNYGNSKNFSLLYLRDKTILLVWNDNQVIRFSKFQLTLRGNSHKLEPTSYKSIPSNEINEISCEEFIYNPSQENLQRICCLYSSNQSQNKNSILMVDEKLEVVVQKELSFSQVSDYKYSKLIKMTNESFVVGILDDKKFVFQYCRILEDDIKEVLTMTQLATFTNMYSCQSPSELLDIISLNENFFIMACYDENNIVRLAKVMLVYNQGAKASPISFKYTPEEKISRFHLAKFGEVFSLVFTDIYGVIQYQLAEYMFCKDETETVILNKLNDFDLSNYFTYSTIFSTTKKFNIQFSSLPLEGSISNPADSSEVLVDTDYSRSDFSYLAPNQEKKFLLKYTLYSTNIKIGYSESQSCQLTFDVKPCHQNCLDCIAVGDDSDNKCTQCNSGYGQIDDTQNCVLLPCPEKYVSKDKKCLNCKTYSKYKVKGTNECISNKPPTKGVVDEAFNFLDDCYSMCETCDYVGNGTSQKCTSCVENFFLDEAGNCAPDCGELKGRDDDQKKCVNCKTLNPPQYKVVGEEKCRKDKPDNSYIVDSNYNLVFICDPSCEKCKEDMCISCKQGLVEHPKNASKCVELCDLTKYNWYIDNDDQYRCTRDKKCERTENAYLKILYNNECISRCPKPLFQYGKECVSFCPKDMIENERLRMCMYKENQDLSTKEIEEMTEIIKDVLVVTPNEPILIRENGYILQAYAFNSTLQNQLNLSFIYLGECEEKLRNHYTYILPDDVLILTTVDMETNTTANKIEYNVYDSNGNKLDLSVCRSHSPIQIYTPVKSLDNSVLEIAKELLEKDIDIYNPKSDFFNDICFSFSKNGADVLLKDRRKYFYGGNVFCESGCEYISINSEEKRALCSCEPKDGLTLRINNTASSKRNAEADFQKAISSSNLNTLNCISKLKGKKVAKNIGFWISFFFMIGQGVLIFFLYKEYYYWIEIVDKCVPKSGANPPQGSDKHVIFRIGRKEQPTENTTEFTEQIKTSGKEKTGQTILISSKANLTSSSQTLSSQIKRTSINTTSLFSTPKPQNIQEDSSSKELFETENYFYLYDLDDIDKYPFELALKEDQRKFIDILKKKLIEKQVIIRGILGKTTFELSTLNFSVYLFYIYLLFLFNALFYSDHLLSSRFKQGGHLTFFQGFLRSSLACIVSRALISFIKFPRNLYGFMDEMIDDIKDPNDYNILAELLRKNLSLKLKIFFISEFAIMIFCLIYLSCFCMVYESTQGSWFGGCWCSIGISILVYFILCLLFTVLRYFAFYFRSNTLYNVHLFINWIY